MQLLDLPEAEKSTIAKLIASLWDVDSGSIKIGGVDVKELALTDFTGKLPMSRRTIICLMRQFVKISDREIQTLRMNRWLRLQRRAAVMNLSCS